MKAEDSKSNLAYVDGQISGDGDYKMLVDFLIEENKLLKILFPNRKFASSLYKKLEPQYYDYLDNEGVRKKLL